MTTYRLADGVEVPSLDVNGSTDNRVWVTHPTLGQILIDRDKLTEVKPPLPLEPPNGTVYSNEADAIVRCDDENDPQGCWYTTCDKQMWRWDEIAPTVAQPGWRRYVPDPADDAPELPWTLDSCRRSASVGTPKHGTVVVDVPGIDYTPGELEQIARALLAAARAAREVDTP